MKITIIGSSGGGKSVLARRISDRFHIPRIEIDRLWFKHGGHKCVNGCTPEQKRAINDKILADLQSMFKENESWISEGTYSGLQPLIAAQADKVIVIKRPLVKRIISHVKRVLKGVDRHPEVSWGQDLLFVKTMIKRWRNHEEKKLDALAEQFAEKLVILKSFKEIDAFFDSLTKEEMR